MATNVGSKTQFGLPLDTPSAQTILPVGIVQNSTFQVVGMFAIPLTTFDGTETTYVVQPGAGGTVDIQSVTLPAKAAAPDYPPSQQFMAVTYTYEEAKPLPWGGFSEFIYPETTGYYSRWSTPTGLRRHWYDPGSLIGSFLNGMDFYPVWVPPTAPTPDPVDGTLRWAVSLDLAAIQPQCTFFDFNWVTLFQESIFSAEPNTQGGSNTWVPMQIMTVTQPAGGEFRAAILQRPEYVAGGGTMFDTVRILRMTETVAPGDYVFEFEVTASLNGIVNTTPVILTMTVV